jgi:hypothetical protein
MAGALVLVALCGCRNAISTSNGQPPVRPTAQPSSRTSVCGREAGFALSIASNARGQSTPEGAAIAFASWDPRLVHLTGWREISRTDGAAYVQVSNLRLEVIQAPRGGWIVDGGDCL